MSPDAVIRHTWTYAKRRWDVKKHGPVFSTPARVPLSALVSRPSDHVLGVLESRVIFRLETLGDGSDAVTGEYHNVEITLETW